MTEDDTAAFLASTQRYTNVEVRAELGSLTSGEFESLTLSDADGADHLITYDAAAGAFTVTAS